MQEYIDPRDAVQLKKRTLLILNWYNRRTGYRFAIAKVVASKPNRYLKIRVWKLGPDPKISVERLKLRHRLLMQGKQEYSVREPNEKELESIAKHFDKCDLAALGWRYYARKRFERLSSWQYWAARRALELSR